MIILLRVGSVVRDLHRLFEPLLLLVDLREAKRLFLLRSGLDLGGLQVLDAFGQEFSAKLQL